MLVAAASSQGRIMASKFECAICFDLAENPILFPCGHGCCADHVDELHECAWTCGGCEREKVVGMRVCGPQHSRARHGRGVSKSAWSVPPVVLCTCAPERTKAQL